MPVLAFRGRPRDSGATSGTCDAESLVAPVELSRFAEGRAGISELRAHLARRVEVFLREDA